MCLLFSGLRTYAHAVPTAWSPAPFLLPFQSDQLQFSLWISAQLSPLPAESLPWHLKPSLGFMLILCLSMAHPHFSPSSSYQTAPWSVDLSSSEVCKLFLCCSHHLRQSLAHNKPFANTWWVSKCPTGMGKTSTCSLAKQASYFLYILSGLRHQMRSVFNQLVH